MEFSGYDVMVNKIRIRAKFLMSMKGYARARYTHIELANVRVVGVIFFFNFSSGSNDFSTSTEDFV